MNANEVSKLVLAMTAAWPTLQVDEFRIGVWATMIAHIRPETGVLALQMLMSRNTFPPSIAEFRKACWEIETPKEARLDEGQAWGLVDAAISQVYRNQKRSYEPFYGLPEKALSVCKEIGLDEIATGDLDVVRSNFIRLYRGASERERNEAVLPQSLKECIAQLQTGEQPEGLPGGFGIVVAKSKAQIARGQVSTHA